MTELVFTTHAIERYVSRCAPHMTLTEARRYASFAINEHRKHVEKVMRIAASSHNSKARRQLRSALALLAEMGATQCQLNAYQLPHESQVRSG